MSQYYYCAGMMRPYWVVSIINDWPQPGDETVCAMNQEADTDMGNLYGDEFRDFFPDAMPISHEQYMGRSVSSGDWIEWMRSRDL